LTPKEKNHSSGDQSGKPRQVFRQRDVNSGIDGLIEHRPKHYRYSQGREHNRALRRAFCNRSKSIRATAIGGTTTSVNVASVTPLSIQALNGFPTHCSGLPDNRAYTEEFSVFEVVGRITYIAHEDDRDYHIALEDANNPAFSVVAELANTLCIGGGEFSAPEPPTKRGGDMGRAAGESLSLKSGRDDRAGEVRRFLRFCPQAARTVAKPHRAAPNSEC